jgi:hypothetical protein
MSWILPTSLRMTPLWQKIRKLAKIRKFIPPEKLEGLMEQHGWNKTT